MRIRAFLVTVAAIVLAAPAGASAAITVANTNDSGSGSLRQALLDAPPGDTITVPVGTYTLTSGPLQISKGVTISGHGSGDTIVRAGGPFRIFEISGMFNVAISGLTIRDANVVTPPAQGGGILSINANLALSDLFVTNNVVNANGASGSAGGSAYGAGILVSGGALSLTNSVVTGNVATAEGGSGKAGGLAEGGGLLTLGPLTIVNSTISNNLANARGGQGPSNSGQNGGLAEGGGLIAVPGENPPTTVIGSTISGNVADGSAGPGATGGLAEGGGVLLVTNNPPVALANTTIAANFARARSAPSGSAIGGGMLAVATNPGSVSLSSVTISGNGIEGGGSGSMGGNVYGVGSPAQRFSFGNTIVANGFGPAATQNCAPIQPPSEPVTVSLGFNLDSLDQCTFHAPGDLVNRNPLLGPLQLNGGPTATMAPALNSPVIDQGSSFGLSTDQRGLVRPLDFPTIPNSPAPGANGADIGAYELQPSSAFSFGKLKRNRKKGTATLLVNLPQPSTGILALSGKGLKPRTATIAGQASVTFKVVATGSVRKALRKRGKRKVKINVTYTPTGNAALTQSRTTKLVKKKRHHHRKHGRG